MTTGGKIPFKGEKEKTLKISLAHKNFHLTKALLSQGAVRSVSQLSG